MTIASETEDTADTQDDGVVSVDAPITVLGESNNSDTPNSGAQQVADVNAPVCVASTCDSQSGTSSNEVG